jgi:hypothetical protein
MKRNQKEPLELKLGQIFWMREERSDFECLVTRIKKTEHLKNQKIYGAVLSIKCLEKYD